VQRSTTYEPLRHKVQRDSSGDGDDRRATASTRT
jgi:hypothetical protein